MFFFKICFQNLIIKISYEFFQILSFFVHFQKIFKIFKIIKTDLNDLIVKYFIYESHKYRNSNL